MLAAAVAMINRTRTQVPRRIPRTWAEGPPFPSNRHGDKHFAVCQTPASIKQTRRLVRRALGQLRTFSAGSEMIVAANLKDQTLELSR